MTDAAHLMSDVSSFVISLAAISMSDWTPTPHASFGFYRAEILGALVSIFIIWGITVALVWEAVERIIHANLLEGEANYWAVDGFILLIVSSVGLGVNLILMLILGGHGHSHGGADHGHSHGGGAGLGHHDTHDDHNDSEENHGHSHSHHEREENHGHSHDSGNHSGHSHDDHSGHSHDDHSGHSHDDHSGHSHDDHHHGHSHGDASSLLSRKDHHEDCPHDDTSSIPSKAGKKKSKKSKAASTENINVTAAYIHVIGDMIQSIGGMVAGALIYFIGPSFKLADPICTLLFAILVMFTTVGVFKSTTAVLMEFTPPEISLSQLRNDLLQNIPGVVDVHHLRVWTLTLGRNYAVAHVIIAKGGSDSKQSYECAHYDALRAANKVFKRYNIDDTTLQVEHTVDALSSSSLDEKVCYSTL
jgi:zinc transporter 2